MSQKWLKRTLLFFLISNLMLIIGGVQIRHRPAELKITFLDVGQGDAAVVESPSGKVMLIDTGGLLHGGDNEGRKVVAPFLRSEGINHIDTIVLTHPHADHIGGAVDLLDRFSVDVLADNGQDEEVPLVAAILKETHSRGALYHRSTRGETFDFGDGVRAEVLEPVGDTSQRSENNASLILKIEYGSTSCLMTGDAEAGEEEALENTGDFLQCDVLKVGHHGSHTSTTLNFLSAVHPKIAVISVGAHNHFGHPSLEVTDRLRGIGAAVYRTDKNGAVTCRSDGLSFRAAPMIP